MEIKCVNLDLMRDQLAREGVIKLDRTNPPTQAKLAIARALGPVKLVDASEIETPKFEVPETDDSAHQQFIQIAREEAEKSTCWMNGSGALAVDDEGNVIARGHNHPVLSGKFCHDLPITFNEVRKLLKPGERLDFCQNIHDVVGTIAEAARDGRRIGGLRWYLSLEPCDNCANALVTVAPTAVYFSLGLDRARYYNSVGLQRLMMAEVPTYFVKMPGQ